MTTEFDRIISYNFSPAERTPVFLTDLGGGTAPPAGDGDRYRERPERKSLMKLIVVLAVMFTVLCGIYAYQSMQGPEVGAPVRAGVNCMDDAGGGVYCWRSE